MPGERKRTKKVGLRFSETMSGYLAEGAEGFEEGEKRGQEQDNRLSFDVTIEIESVSDFVKLSGQEPKMRGRDACEDMTKLFTRLSHGRQKGGTLVGSGVLRFKMLDLPSMLSSFEVTNTHSPITKIRTISTFVQFCYGAAKETYLPSLNYHTRYENLVLRGKVVSDGGALKNFFFFSGIHDKDFPWGDGEIFWDIGLVIEKGDGGWERYGLTDRIIEKLELDVEKGVYGD